MWLRWGKVAVGASGEREPRWCRCGGVAWVRMVMAWWILVTVVRGANVAILTAAWIIERWVYRCVVIVFVSGRLRSVVMNSNMNPVEYPVHCFNVDVGTDCRHASAVSKVSFDWLILATVWTT